MLDLGPQLAARIQFIAVAEDRQQSRRHRSERTIEPDQPRGNPVSLEGLVQAFRDTTIVMAVTEETPVAEVALHEPSPEEEALSVDFNAGATDRRPDHQTRSSGTWYWGSA